MSIVKSIEVTAISLLRGIENSAGTFSNSFRIHGCSGDHILQRHSGRIEDDDFVRRSASGFCSGNYLTEFGMYVLFSHQIRSNGMMQLSYGRTLLYDVNYCFVLSYECRFQFLFSLTVSSHGCYKSARLHTASLEKELS